MIARIKFWLAALGLVVTALAASWFGGRKVAQNSIKLKQSEARLKAIEEAKEIENEVEALDHDTLKSRARVWVRGPKR